MNSLYSQKQTFLFRFYNEKHCSASGRLRLFFEKEDWSPFRKKNLSYLHFKGAPTHLIDSRPFMNTSTLKLEILFADSTVYIKSIT